MQLLLAVLSGDLSIVIAVHGMLHTDLTDAAQKEGVQPA